MCAQSIQIKKWKEYKKHVNRDGKGSDLREHLSLRSVKEISESSQYCGNANFHFPYFRCFVFIYLFTLTR